MTLIISNPSQQPGGASGEIPSGTVFPLAPLAGQMFLFTPFSSVYQYSGSAWVNIQSLAAFTMYVDSAGADSNGKGTGSGANAFLTFAYALSNLPLNYGGHVTIVLGSGNFDFPSTVESRNTNGYFTFINGNLTQEVQSSSTTLFRENRVTGGGQVQTTGSSTTVNVIGGGNTDNLCVGGIVLANSLYRYVTAINSSTQFTVNAAVDWSAGYSWQYWNLGTLYDSSATWSDNQYDGGLLVNGSTLSLDPLTYVPAVNANDIDAYPIKTTYATSKRLELGCPLGVSPTSFTTYRVYTLNTTIRAVNSDSIGAQILLDGMVFRCVKLSNSGAGLTITFNAVSVVLFGCHLTPASGSTFVSCSLFLKATRCFALTIFGSANGKHNNNASLSTDITALKCYFTSFITIDSARTEFRYCITDISATTAFFVRRGVYRVQTVQNTNVVRNTGGAATTGLDATISGVLQAVTTVPGANGGGVFVVGFTSAYTVSAAQMSYVT